MSMNGTGEVAVDWSTTLERLTMRLDIRNLNLRLWANGLPPWGSPASNPCVVSGMLSRMAREWVAYLSATALDAPDHNDLSTAHAAT
jgi:hypothetical protein